MVDDKKEPEPRWWEEAIFYAVDVGRYYDGSGNGIGDFSGLVEKVPYIAELGVTCIWLLPFYPSSNKDNGYDITDYYEIERRHGSLNDFIEFIHRAGEHGIRVIIDLVMEHTSNQHPWFLAARNDEQSHFRDYYFWSPSPDPLPPDRGSVFPGQETTVWTYDEVARAYYHHRFYDFEPGLNTDSPEVRREIKQVIDYWLSFGVAGFRVDAARYMVRLPLSHDRQHKAPHSILHELYDFAKKRRSNTVMLGEVDAAQDQLDSYFEDGQLDTMFNFALCSYLYLGLATESAEVIWQGWETVPTPPEGQEWINMLRNLDEANLEWLDKEQREQVFAAFAPEEEMRIFDRGIRRRLASMMNGDLQHLKLAYSLLFSLPGPPLLAYGDEIGMGDDLSQPGRNAARLPMQWSDGKHGGFSDVPASKLQLPTVAKGPFGYKQRNVEQQLADEDSLLHHIMHLIKLRRQYKPIDRIHFEQLDPQCKHILAHRYRGDRQQLILLHNLSGKQQKCSLQTDPKVTELRDLFTDETIELDRGSTELTLPGHGFRWLATPLHEDKER